MRLSARRMSSLLVAVFATTTVTSPATAQVTIRLQEQWSNVYGETEPTFHFQIASSRPTEVVVRWSYSANRRTILRAEKDVDVSGKDPVGFDVKLTVPRVNEGIIFATDLAVRVSRRGEQDPLATFAKRIWVFPRDPFAQRMTWLDELSMELFDPAETTAKILDSSEIPYHQVRDVAAIGRLKEGILVIGAGVSLDSYRGLVDAALAAACRGVPVLCLAPAAGRLNLHTADATPERLEFRRNDIITELDKRLDSQQWLGSGELVASRFDYTSYRGNVILRTTDSIAAWPWIEARYGTNTPMIVCGFSLIEHWNEGPAPRFLFARLLEYLTNGHSKEN